VTISSLQITGGVVPFVTERQGLPLNTIALSVLFVVSVVGVGAGVWARAGKVLVKANTVIARVLKDIEIWL
jgi:hypothetical protein